MTFQGDTIIGKPSLAMVEIYIAEKGLYCEAKECFDYWENKEWLTHKGVSPKTLESAIASYNNIVVCKAAKVKKKSKRKSNIKKTRKIIAGNKGLYNLVKLESFTRNQAKKDEKFESYNEQLKDKRWFAFRSFIFSVRGKVCECCGASTRLQVHHPKYVYGKKAWEYTCNDVMVVCRDCHQKIHGIKQKEL